MQVHAPFSSFVFRGPLSSLWVPGEARRMPALGEDQEEECVVVVAGLRRAPLDSVGVLSRPGVCVCVCVCVCV